MIENVLVDHGIINLIKMKGTDLSPEKEKIYITIMKPLVKVLVIF